MMRYRKLGKTGLMVSEVGLGGGGIGEVWGETSGEEIAATIELALAEGVNFFDVAPSYGDGRAESNLGAALGDAARRVIIATKVYLEPEELDDIAGAAERSLQASLERLGREHVDVFQLHNPISQERGAIGRSVGVEDVLGGGGAIAALNGLREAGLTKLIGLTGVGEARVVRRVLEEGGLDTVQVYYNVLNPSAARPLPEGSSMHDHGQLLPLAEELGLGVIGIRNLAAGALADGIDRAVAKDSLVARDERRREALGALRDSGLALAQPATRFVLDHPGVSTVIPGAKNRGELGDALQAMELPALDAATHERLDALRAEDFGVAEPAGSSLF